MKKRTLVIALRALCALSLVSASACVGGDPLKTYVDVEVPLKVSSGAKGVTAAGELDFTARSYHTAMHQVCDEYECGGYQQVCAPDTQECDGSTEVCDPSQTVCDGDSEVCTPVTRCTGDGCTTDSVCHTESGSCHEEGGGCHSEPDCHTVPGECSQQYVSQTCETNCRQEPYQAEDDTNVPTKIMAAIQGLSDASKLQGLYLGVKTNDQFVAAFDDPTQRPKNYGYLWNVLAKDQKTVVVAAAKGYKLSANQNFLALPSTFKPGDDVNITLEFEADSSKTAKNGVSATGTSADFPDLSYDK